MNDIYIAIAVTLLGLVLSALYSGLETGLYTINKIRLDVRASDGLASAKRLLTLLNQPTRMLAVLLVCNNVANYVASYGVASFPALETIGTMPVHHKILSDQTSGALQRYVHVSVFERNKSFGNTSPKINRIGIKIRVFTMITVQGPRSDSSNKLATPQLAT